MLGASTNQEPPSGGFFVHGGMQACLQIPEGAKKRHRAKPGVLDWLLRPPLITEAEP